MKKFVLIVVIGISFFLLYRLSWRLGQTFFTRPFNKALYDPVLFVCRDHVEFRLLHEFAESEAASASGEGCTLQVTPERQKWVEEVVPQMKSPGDSSWTVRVKQLGGNGQWIDLELLGDGVAGLIYEVRNNRITPLNSRMTGTGGIIYPITIDLLLWVVLWLTVWGGRRLVLRRTSNR